ncbi:MAG: GntR family transcriptional regulator [Atopobiaceae bacterium]
MDALDLIAHDGIDAARPMTLRAQIESRIRQLVAAGALTPGTRLPAERQLAERLGVSRTTVRLVYEALEEDGMVSRTPGRGTIVQAVLPQKSDGYGYSFTAEMLAEGRTPASRVLGLEKVAADRDQASALEVSEGAPLWEIRRVRLADGVPLSYHRIYIPVARLEHLERKDLEGSLQRVLAERGGLVPASMDGVYEAVNLDAQEARMLGTRRNAAALRLVRINYSSSGLPYELAYILSRADCYRLDVHFGNGSSTFRKVLKK